MNIRQVAIVWANTTNKKFATGLECEKAFRKECFYRIYENFAFFHDEEAKQVHFVSFDCANVDLSIIDNSHHYEYDNNTETLRFGLYFDDDSNGQITVLSTKTWKAICRNPEAKLKTSGYAVFEFVDSDGDFYSFYNI